MIKFGVEQPDDALNGDGCSALIKDVRSSTPASRERTFICGPGPVRRWEMLGPWPRHPVGFAAGPPSPALQRLRHERDLHRVDAAEPRQLRLRRRLAQPAQPGFGGVASVGPRDIARRAGRTFSREPPASMERLPGSRVIMCADLTYDPASLHGGLQSDACGTLTLRLSTCESTRNHQPGRQHAVEQRRNPPCRQHARYWPRQCKPGP